MADRISAEARYTTTEIERYEAIYGKHYVSPGGEDTTREFLSLVPLGAASTVLDVGCGVGGSAFYLARTYGCQVDGIDLSVDMIRMAKERCRAQELERKISFHQADCLDFKYPRNDYSLVYSRDTFLHIHDKPRLFEIMRNCLRPEGHLLFTDYIRGSAPASVDFSKYIEKYEYALETLEGYRRLLTSAGFDVIRADDLRDRFISIHRQELERLPTTGLSPDDIQYLEDRWRAKIGRAERGEQGWALFQAQPTGH